MEDTTAEFNQLEIDVGRPTKEEVDRIVATRFVNLQVNTVFDNLTVL